MDWTATSIYGSGCSVHENKVGKSLWAQQVPDSPSLRGGHTSVGGSLTTTTKPPQQKLRIPNFKSRARIYNYRCACMRTRTLEKPLPSGSEPIPCHWGCRLPVAHLSQPDQAESGMSFRVCIMRRCKNIHDLFCLLESANPCVFTGTFPWRFCIRDHPLNFIAQLSKASASMMMPSSRLSGPSSVHKPLHTRSSYRHVCQYYRGSSPELEPKWTLEQKWPREI